MVDLNITPKQKYIIMGDITNNYIDLAIYNLESMTVINNADVLLEYNGQTIQLPNINGRFTLHHWIRPATPYSINLSISGSSQIYNGVLPDSSNLSLIPRQINDFNYHMDLKLSGAKPIGNIFSWLAKSDNSFGSEFMFIDSSDFSNGNHYDIKPYSYCFNPLDLSKNHVIFIREIVSQQKSWYDYKKEYDENINNPLYLLYAWPDDNIDNEFIFRLFESTIHRFTLNINDTSNELIDIEVVGKSGQKLTNSLFDKVNYTLVMNNNTASFDSKNLQTSLSLNNLAQLDKSTCYTSRTQDLNSLLNKKIIITADVHYNNKIYNVNQEVTLQDLETRQNIEFRINM